MLNARSWIVGLVELLPYQYFIKLQPQIAVAGCDSY